MRRRRRYNIGTLPYMGREGTPVTERRQFGSLAEFAEYASKAEHDVRSSAWDMEGSEHRKHSWTFGVGLPGAVKLASTGWAEGAAKAKRLLDHIALPPAENVHSETYMDVQGAYVDVGEYVMGTPECMVDFHQDKRRARFADIIVSGCYSASHEGEGVMARGVAIAAVVDALESHGVRCNVMLAVRVGESQLEITLKAPTDPLNLDTLTFALAHPACFRRLCFAAREREPEEVRERHGYYMGGGYGWPTPLEEPGGATFVFQTMRYSEEWTPEYALAKVNEILAKVTDHAATAGVC